MERDQLVVGPMPDAGLRRAITGPAGASGLRVESALIEAMVADTNAAGRTLATADGDTVRSWDVAFPAGLLDGACAIAGQSLTRQQWAGYAGTQPFQRVCPAS